MAKGTEDMTNANRLWVKRVIAENRVHGVITNDVFPLYQSPALVSRKITEKKSVLRNANDEQTFKEIRAKNTFCNVSQLPREKFLLPQTSSQELGWLASQSLLTRKGSETLTGLSNWEVSYAPKEHKPYLLDHHVGLVTCLGDFSYPEKRVEDEEQVVRNLTSKALTFLPPQTPYYHPKVNSDVCIYAEGFQKNYGCSRFSKSQASGLKKAAAPTKAK